MMSWDVWLRCYNERGSELMFEATSIPTQQLEKSLEKKKRFIFVISEYWEAGHTEVSDGKGKGFVCKAGC